MVARLHKLAFNVLVNRMNVLLLGEGRRGLVLKIPCVYQAPPFHFSLRRVSPELPGFGETASSLTPTALLRFRARVPLPAIRRPARTDAARR